MSAKRQTNPNQLTLPLDYSGGNRESSHSMDEAHGAINALRKEKNLLKNSHDWHFHHLKRLWNVYEQLKNRSCSSINESRLIRVRGIIITMIKRIDLEINWAQELKDRFYRLL